MRELVEQLVRSELAQYSDVVTELKEEVDDLHRRLRNIIRPGICVEAAESTVRVQHGGNKTPPIKWFSVCAGGVREYRRPSVGEQCLLLNYALGDNSSQTFALFGLFSDSFPAPTNKASEHKRIYPDGTDITYDHESHHLAITMNSGTAYFGVPERVMFDTALLTCTGDIHADGQVSDNTRTMQGDRDIYNGHDHPDAGVVNQNQ